MLKLRGYLLRAALCMGIFASFAHASSETINSDPFNFEGLPPDIKRVVYRHCPPETLLALGQTSRQHSTGTNTNEVWTGLLSPDHEALATIPGTDTFGKTIKQLWLLDKKDPLVSVIIDQLKFKYPKCFKILHSYGAAGETSLERRYGGELTTIQTHHNKTHILRKSNLSDVSNGKLYCLKVFFGFPIKDRGSHWYFLRSKGLGEDFPFYSKLILQNEKDQITINSITGLPDVFVEFFENSLVLDRG